MLNTSGMSAGSGKEKPVMGPGNQIVKINSISFDVTPYAADAFNIMLHVESEPMDGEFQGFLLDPNNSNGPRYAGQVGRVRFSQYPYKDAVLPNGNEISRDTEVMKAMIFLSEQIGKRTELDAIQANTIEDFMAKCNTVLSGPTYLNVCLGTREWENKEGYINNDLYLPKMSKAGIPLESIDVENSRLLIYNTSDKNHYRPVVKQDVPTTNAFEPSVSSGDDFDL
tara:strand:+ start:1247 stop:1921 length:675 start_codon:yes stop_codon:yes gene_type:complete